MKKIILLIICALPIIGFGQVRWEQIKPISAQLEKTTPAGNDMLLLEDSEASGQRKYVKISNLPTVAGSIIYPAAGISVSTGSAWGTSASSSTAGQLLRRNITNTGYDFFTPNYLTSYTETDPNIYLWAKASTKPSYTYSEVGAASSGHNHSGTYEPIISPGTTSQYWRGDKTWQTLPSYLSSVNSSDINASSSPSSNDVLGYFSTTGYSGFVWNSTTGTGNIVRNDSPTFTGSPIIPGYVKLTDTPGGILGGTWSSPTLDDAAITSTKINAYGSKVNGYALTYNSTYDLSWSPMLSGSGTSGRVAYWNGSTSLTSNSSFTYVSGTGVTAENFIQSSDRRLKERIRKMENLNWVDKIQFKNFEFRGDISDRLRYGVIAQEIQKVNPELVFTDENGYKAVGYIDLLIAKVARQDELINDLMKRLNKIENEK